MLCFKWMHYFLESGFNTPESRQAFMDMKCLEFLTVLASSFRSRETPKLVSKHVTLTFGATILFWKSNTLGKLLPLIMRSANQRGKCFLAKQCNLFSNFLCLHDFQSSLSKLFLPGKYYDNLRWWQEGISKAVWCLSTHSELAFCGLSSELSVWGCVDLRVGRTCPVTEWACMKHVDCDWRKSQPLLS